MGRVRKFSLGPRDKQIIKILNVYLRDLKKKFPEIKAKKVMLLRKQDSYFKTCMAYVELDSKLIRIATRSRVGMWYSKWEELDSLAHEAAHTCFVDVNHGHGEDFWKLHYKFANYIFNTIHNRRKDLWRL